MVASLLISTFIHLSTDCTRAADINRTKIKKFLGKLISTSRLLPPNIKAALIDQQNDVQTFSGPRKISITVTQHERPKAKYGVDNAFWSKMSPWNANDITITWKYISIISVHIKHTYLIYNKIKLYIFRYIHQHRLLHIFLSNLWCIRDLADICGLSSSFILVCGCKLPELFILWSDTHPRGGVLPPLRLNQARPCLLQLLPLAFSKLVLPRSPACARARGEFARLILHPEVSSAEEGPSGSRSVYRHLSVRAVASGTCVRIVESRASSTKGEISNVDIIVPRTCYNNVVIVLSPRCVKVLQD